MSKEHQLLVIAAEQYAAGEARKDLKIQCPDWCNTKEKREAVIELAKFAAGRAVRFALSQCFSKP